MESKSLESLLAHFRNSMPETVYPLPNSMSSHAAQDCFANMPRPQTTQKGGSYCFRAKKKILTGFINTYRLN